MPDLSDILLGIHNMTAPPERETYIRAPFGWPGGKWQSLKYLIPQIPKTTKVFVDVCGGSGIVTINSPDWIKLKVFNDRHAGVTAFYRCLKDPIKQQRIVDWIAASCHSREEFVWCRDSWEDCTDDVERAARWYYMLRTSFSQLGRNWGRSTNSPNMLAKKLHSALADFGMFHQIWKDVQVENLDACQCIKDYESPDTTFYVDPDYIGTDPGIYKHGVNHPLLLDTIANSRGYFMVSGYDNPLYNSKDFWTDRKEWEVSVSTTANAFNEENHLVGKENVMTRDRKAKEVLWIKEHHE